MGQAVLTVLYMVIAMFGIIGFGAWMTHKRWIDAPVSDFMAKVVTRVALPAMILSNFNQYFTRDQMVQSLVNLPAPMISMTACTLLAWGIAYATQLKKNRRGLFVSMFAYSNTVFLGLPVCEAIFGESAIPLALYFYLANTLLFWTLAVWGIARDGQKGPVPWKQWLARLFSPPIVMTLVAGAVTYFQIPVPSFVLSGAKYLAGLCTPLALLFIGATLYASVKNKLRWFPGLGWMMAGRMLIGPVLCLFFCWLLRVNALITQVFMIQACMPAMSQTPMVARTYGADEEFAAAGTAMSTVLCLAALPVVRVLQMALMG